MAKDKNAIEGFKMHQIEEEIIADRKRRGMTKCPICHSLSAKSKRCVRCGYQL